MSEIYTSWKEAERKAKIPRGLGIAKDSKRPLGELPKADKGAERAIKGNVLDSIYLQDPITGKRVAIPRGSAAAASLFFHQPPDAAIQDPQGTGIFQPASDSLGIAAGGILQQTVDPAKALFEQDIWFKSGTSFNGKMENAITADRTWTFPDASGTLALAGSTVERKESHVTLFLEDPEHIC